MFRIDLMSYGRFGNKLIYYNNLRQLANIYNVPYSCVPWEGQGIFSGIEKEFKYPKKDVINLTSKEILSAEKNDINKILENYEISLVAPCLGELFFEVTKSNPNDFLNMQTEDNEMLVIALHFRGSDFFAWNPDACLPASYYLSAIEACEKEFTEDKKYILCTEDTSYGPFNEIKQFLENEKKQYDLGPATKENKHFYYDFNKLANSDVIVSSPSTFSICAGFLAKEKKVIHSKEWIDNRLNVKDKFWVQLNKGGNQWYNIWKTL
jgi:hypothetical protein